MNLLRNLLTIGCIFTLASANAEDKPTPGYVTAKEVTAMAPRTGTLVDRSPCSSSFTTADGKGFYIGDPSSGADITHFIWTLKSKQSYKFPAVFLDYQAAPKYETVKEITEMAPRTATLLSGWDGGGYFQATDGKGFHIGGEQSEEVVDQFLRTLEEDKSYKFPDAFLEYQKQSKSK